MRENIAANTEDLLPEDEPVNTSLAMEEWLESIDWPDWYRRHFLPIRLSFIRLAPKEERYERVISLVGGTPHHMKIRYYEEDIRFSIAQALDDWLAIHPFEIVAFAGDDAEALEKVSIEEAARYAELMQWCLSSAIPKFQERYRDLLHLARFLACQEIAAEAVDKLIRTSYARKPFSGEEMAERHPIEEIIDFSIKKQKERLGVKPGRKKGAGLFRCKEDLEDRILIAVFDCYATGRVPKRQDVVDYFNKMNQAQPSFVPPCSSVDQLKDWMRTYQISWTELLKENPNLPIWWDDFQKGLKNVFGFIEKMKESSRGRK